MTRVPIPMEGRVFGLLTVISRAGKSGRTITWLCECECGKSTIVRGDSLRLGKTRSCGCLLGGVANPELLRMEGKSFGRLIVVRREGPEAGFKTRWFCECTCGGTAVVRGDDLRKGNTRSCGCLQREARFRPPQPPRACSSCGELAEKLFRGWCGTCYRRWYRNGQPEDGPPQPRWNTEALNGWRAIATPPSVAAEVSDLAAGTAAEHLVCAELLLSGYWAFRTDQLCPYDVAVDPGRSGQLIRIQVKSTREPRVQTGRKAGLGPVYRFKTERSRSRRPYPEGSFDLIALVALDIYRIAYLPKSMWAGRVDIRRPGTPTGKQFDDFPFAKAIAELGRA